jgi:hypothetical protein
MFNKFSIVSCQAQDTPEFLDVLSCRPLSNGNNLHMVNGDSLL